jgi:NAD(P)-dependent dehydrogenase (short-subunit alcohol dehydrogenase family)
VYIAARNREKTDAAIQVLKNETGKEAHFLQLDLSDLKSVRAAAVAFIEYVCLLSHSINTSNLLPDRSPRCTS